MLLAEKTIEFQDMQYTYEYILVRWHTQYDVKPPKLFHKPLPIASKHMLTEQGSSVRKLV